MRRIQCEVLHNARSIEKSLWEDQLLQGKMMENEGLDGEDEKQH